MAAPAPPRLDEYLLLMHPLLSKHSTDMERALAFALSNFSTIVIFSSLGWMILRAWQVLSKPSDALIDLLGIEVPSPPALALHGIKADGVILNWKAPDLQKSAGVRYALFVNGIHVSDLSPLETSIAVADLKPGTNYIIRVVAVNPLNFEAKSEPIHVQTREAGTGDFFRKRDSQDAGAEGAATSAAEKSDTVPTVRSYKLLGDASAAAAAAPTMMREHSGSISQGGRKSISGRRISAAASHEHGLQESVDEGEETVRELTAKLDKLNQEIEGAREDIAKEDDEFHEQQTGLNLSKGELKQAVTDKESASKALKKQVADLGGQNSSAQAKRQAAERRLLSKQEERLKLHEDIRRWEKEVVLMRADAESLAEKKLTARSEADEELEKLRAEVAEETATNKTMEEEVRQARTEVKELENQKVHMDQEGTDEVHAPAPLRQGSDSDWQARLNMLQYNYQFAFSKLEQARNFCAQAQARQDDWERRRAAEPHMFLSPPMMDFHLRKRHSGNRPQRSMSLRNTELNPQSSPFEMSSPPPYSAAVSNNISPPFASVSPFFNMMNGTVIPPHDISTGMTQEQVDQLTGGGPTSPSIAGALLPSGLLGDDEPSRLGSLDSGSSQSSPLASNALPGLGAPQTREHAHRDPQSPISNTSRSPSVFASPRESSTHLPFAFNSDGVFDSDRRSIRSTTSSMRPRDTAIGNTSTKFAHIFGFNRQRGKTASGEGPTLGSLRNSESQSFPRQDFEDIESTASRRRGSHSGGTWRDQLQNPFSRSTNKEPVAEAGAPRRRFGIFGPKTGEMPDSPRPGSTASSENQLPRPSANSSSRFGWGAPGDGPFGPRSSTAIGADWGMAAASGWSRHPSRRPSIHGSTHAFSIHEDFPSTADDELAPPRRRSPKLAPIGTRPTSQISTNSTEKPKLNPAAPSFKLSLFGRERKAAEEADKPAKKGKSKKESPKDKLDSRSTSPLPIAEPSSPYPPSSHDAHDLSPPNDPSRFSKDGAPSISTFDTASEPRTSLERTPSRASELTPKETFMQKLSRKSSASMFNFPMSFSSGSKDKSARFPSKKIPSTEAVGGTPDETDEEGGAASGAKTALTPKMVEGGLSPLVGATSAGREAREAAAAGKEKFSFRRSLTGRRKGERAPSIQESETGDEGETTEDEVSGSVVLV
jgi:hypothetical protein